MASIEYVVNATDAASRVFEKIGLSADNLDRQLHDLSDRVATPEVDLKDAKFTAGMIRAAERIDKLSAQVADPKVEVDGRKAQTEILRISAMLDRLDAKRVNVNVDVNRSFLSRLGGLFGGGGGGLSGLFGAGGAAAGAGAQAGGGLLSAAGPYAQGGAIASAIAAALSLGPALLPTGLGLLVGGGAAGGALMLGSKANKQIQQLAQQLQGITGTTAADKQKRAALQAQMAAIRQANAGPLGVFGAFQNLGHSALGVFSGALQSTAGGFSGHPNASFLTGLEDILKQLGGFVKTLQPELANLFRASLPYLQLFTKFLEQAAKTLLPVFTQSLQQMTPFLPLISKGLLSIVQGLAGMIQAIGPRGMKASAEIFIGLCKVMELILVGVGKAANFLAVAIMAVSHFIRAEWPKVTAMFADFGHNVSSLFDSWRHGWAHVWDDLFQFFIGRAIRGGHDIEREWNTWTHGVGVIFDAFRHATAQVWDAIWNNTIGRTRQGVADAVGWFRRLPGEALAALRGFGSSLYSFARAALGDFWNGLKSVGGSILSWIKGWILSIPHAFMSLLHMSPPHPGSVFYDLGASLMHHLEAGIKSRVGSIGSAIAGAVGGGVGATAGGVQSTALQIAKSIGWGNYWGAINAIAMSESGWSMTARNPSSGAYGIAQFINGPGEYYQYGGNPNTASGQIVAFYNYIRQRYGNPANAWAFHLAHGWYDQGGWLPPGLSLALNTTGKPERVGGGGGGNTYNIHVTAPVGSNPRDIGRQIVGYIKSFEQGSGTGWRK